MGLLKRRARNKATRKFEAAPCADIKESTACSEKPKGKPLARRAKAPPESKSYELSITIFVGGADADKGIAVDLRRFLEKEMVAGKCSLERGGAAFHLHYQLVVRIQAISMVAISRLLKTYVGWDNQKPVGGVIISKALTQKALHTFHGMLGYCMKDAGQEHFQTVDHNVSSKDIKIGMEQLAMHGREDSKSHVLLTQRNFAQKCLTWRRWNWKYPAVINWDQEFYHMLKSEKFIPCTSSIVGSFGRGYEPYRMQSLWRMMVDPASITPTNVANVFCQPDLLPVGSMSRKSWFQSRWKEAADGMKGVDSEPCKVDASNVQVAGADACKAKKKFFNFGNNAVSEVLIHTPSKGKMKLPDLLSDVWECGGSSLCVATAANLPALIDDVLSEAHLHTGNKGDIKVPELAADACDGEVTRRKGKTTVSPTRRLWPTEWEMERVFEMKSSSSSTSHEQCQPLLAEEVFVPLYKRRRPRLHIS